jgi:hypothetical protein
LGVLMVSRCKSFCSACGNMVGGWSTGVSFPCCCLQTQNEFVLWAHLHSAQESSLGGPGGAWRHQPHFPSETTLWKENTVIGTNVTRLQRLRGRLTRQSIFAQQDEQRAWKRMLRRYFNEDWGNASHLIRQSKRVRVAWLTAW